MESSDRQIAENKIQRSVDKTKIPLVVVDNVNRFLSLIFANQKFPCYFSLSITIIYSEHTTTFGGCIHDMYV